ncbi:UNKNOWN [Stylonychia lemnae]|uniref:Uncharacterized protein n=1 Tax=Stylonychia lemnae TaxID=5949 RepID=A0A078ASY5_STYLE|nr:UNKNOWN [Stylonychia lemnae]|eukprot:CDW83943.1 UNKNOWN [Stylonychia lemnae]
MNDAILLGESTLTQGLDKLRVIVRALNQSVRTMENTLDYQIKHEDFYSETLNQVYQERIEARLLELKQMEEKRKSPYRTTATPEELLRTLDQTVEDLLNRTPFRVLVFSEFSTALRICRKTNTEHIFLAKYNKLCEAYCNVDNVSKEVELKAQSQGDENPLKLQKANHGQLMAIISDENLTQSQIESQTLLKLSEVSSIIIQDESFIEAAVPTQTKVSYASILAQVQKTQSQSHEPSDPSHGILHTNLKRILDFTLEQAQPYQSSLLGVRPHFFWQMKRKKESEQRIQVLDEQFTMNPSLEEIRDSIYSKDPRLLQAIESIYYNQLLSGQVLLLGTIRHQSSLLITESQTKQTFVTTGKTLSKPQDLLQGRHVFEWWQEQGKTTQLIQGEITNSPISLLKPQDLRAGRYIFEWWQDLLIGTQYQSMVQPIHVQACNLFLRFQQQIYSGLTIRRFSMSSGISDYYIIEEAQFPLLTIISPTVFSIITQYKGKETVSQSNLCLSVSVLSAIFQYDLSIFPARYLRPL